MRVVVHARSCRLCRRLELGDTKLVVSVYQYFKERHLMWINVSKDISVIAFTFNNAKATFDIVRINKHKNYLQTSWLLSQQPIIVALLYRPINLTQILTTSGDVIGVGCSCRSITFVQHTFFLRIIFITSKSFLS